MYVCVCLCVCLVWLFGVASLSDVCLLRAYPASPAQQAIVFDVTSFADPRWGTGQNQPRLTHSQPEANPGALTDAVRSRVPALKTPHPGRGVCHWAGANQRSKSRAGCRAAASGVSRSLVYSTPEQTRRAAGH